MHYSKEYAHKSHLYTAVLVFQAHECRPQRVLINLQQTCQLSHADAAVQDQVLLQQRQSSVTSDFFQEQMQLVPICLHQPNNADY